MKFHGTVSHKEDETLLIKLRFNFGYFNPLALYIQLKKRKQQHTTAFMIVTIIQGSWNPI